MDAITLREMPSAQLRRFLSERIPKGKAGPEPGDSPDPLALERELRRAWSSVARDPHGIVAAEESAQAALAEFLLLLPERQRSTIASDPKYRTWAFASLLCRHSRRVGESVPGDSVYPAELALAAAEANDDLPERVREELRAQCHAYLAFAQARAETYAAAEGSLRLGEACFARGVGDAWLRGLLYYVASELQLRRGAFGEALVSARAARRAFRQVGDAWEEAYSGLQEGKALYFLDRCAEAVSLHEDIRPVVARSSEPRARLFLELNSVCYFAHLERFSEARQCLAAAAGVVNDVAGSRDRIICRWTEAVLAAALREPGAEQSYREVQAALAAEGAAHDLAWVTVELAMHFLDLGRNAEAKRELAAAIPIMRMSGVALDVLASVCLLAESVAAEAMQRATLHLQLQMQLLRGAQLERMR